MSELDSMSLAWLKDPNKWVHFNICPVKRTRAGKVGFDALECGLVVVWEPTVVYVHNLYAMSSGPIEPQLKDCEKYEYENVEALVCDGWRVD